MMRIGTRISPDWLDRPEDLQFLTQIGVDAVDITMDMVPGYLESGGAVTRDGMKMVVEKLGEAGQVIERANCLSGQFHDVYLGGPNAEQETRNACINAEICGEFDIPVLGVQPYAPSVSNTNLPSVIEYVEGRGGYKHAKFELAEALATPRAADAPDEEDLWARHITHYTAICEVAEPAGVKVATHGNDPPVPMLHGYPGILNSVRNVRPSVQRSAIAGQWHNLLCRYSIRVRPKYIRRHQALWRAEPVIPRPLPQRGR